MMENNLIVINDIKEMDLKKSIFIEASAGTGKTYTITRLFLRYIIEENIDYKKILLITFTRKASEEMLFRIKELIQKIIENQEKDICSFIQKPIVPSDLDKLREILKNFDKLHISTIHSFCKSLLNQYPYELNIPYEAEIISDESDILYKVIIEIFNDWEKFEKKYNLNNFLNLKNVVSKIEIIKIKSFIEKFIKEFSRRNKFIINFVDFLYPSEKIIETEFLEFLEILQKDLAEQNKNKEIYKYLLIILKIVYNELEFYKKTKGIFTYDDLVIRLYKSLKNNESFRKMIQNEFLIGIVDEFQDTDPYQWEILKMIFLEKQSNRLVVVGDPKQSIYKFRGADFYTYLSVKENNQNTFNFYVLNKNYRSTRELIAKTNQYFQYIFANNFNYELKYKPIEFPENISQDFQYNSIFAPINFIELKEDRVSQLREELVNEIVNIIKYMINSKIEIYDSENKKARVLKYSDIAILFRSNEGDFKVIKDIFKKNYIPFTDLSNLSIFDTMEADVMELLLSFLANPDDTKIKKAFITYFFYDIPYTKIEVMEEKYSIILNKISEWNVLIAQKKWYELLYKIIEDTKLYYKFFSLPDYEKKLSNFEHLIEIIVERATLNQYSPMELYNEFKKLRRDTQSEENLIRLESEEDKVKCLTIHKSKGLEFPVVFVVGWLDRNAPRVGNNNNYDFFDDQYKIWNICYFYDNIDKSSVQDMIRTEFVFEELRLLYVAITRATTYVFLPKYNESYFKNYLSEVADNNQFPLIPQINFENQKEKILYLETTEKSINIHVDEILKNLIRIENINYLKRRYDLHSYSSLIRSRVAQMEELDRDEDVILEETTEDIIEGVPTEEINNNESTEQNKFDTFFKLGPDTGNFIHKILEKIDFSDFRITELTEKEIKNIKQKYLGLFNYYNTYFNIVEESKIEEFFDFLIHFLYKILTKIKINNHIVLSSLENSKIKKEIGFLIQDIITNDEIKNISGNSFFTGNLDLFFEHKKNYYLLDYKTTILPNYEIETLKDYTEKHYKIQYLLYNYALYLWLHQVKNISLEEKLPGGIIYFYLRGCDNKNTNGIYFREFDEFSKIQDHLNSIINLKSNL